MTLSVVEAVNATKTLAQAPKWVAGERDRLQLLVPLDIDEVTIRGLQLRGVAFVDRPEEVVTFQLEFPHEADRRDLAVYRIDWRPLHSHNNKGIGPEEYRFVEIVGTHAHRFDLNWLDLEGRLRKINLPVAVPESSEPKDFLALLDFVGESFKVKELSKIAPPPWEARLL